MYNPYDILGISRTSTKAQARAAYRKLAQKHHPDKGGSEAKFKEIKAAYEAIDNGWSEPVQSTVPQYSQRSSFTGGWAKPEPVYKRAGSEDGPFKPFNPTAAPGKANPFQARQQRPPKPPYVPPIVQAYQPPTPRKNLGEFVAMVSMAEAYNGFICEIQIDGKKIQVKMPKGVPHGLRNTVSLEDREEDVTIETRFLQSEYSFVGIKEALKESVIVNSSPGIVHRTKDLSISYQISSRTLQTGGLVELHDFLGVKYSTRFPAGWNPRTPLKVEGRGYVDWYSSHSQAGDNRGDVYIRLIPTEDAPMRHI